MCPTNGTCRKKLTLFKTKSALRNLSLRKRFGYD
jgi:hypothetical protein